MFWSLCFVLLNHTLGSGQASGSYLLFLQHHLPGLFSCGPGQIGPSDLSGSASGSSRWPTEIRDKDCQTGRKGMCELEQRNSFSFCLSVEDMLFAGSPCVGFPNSCTCEDMSTEIEVGLN